MKELVIEKMFGAALPPDFNNDTLLVTSRLMDSIKVLALVNELEQRLNIEFEAHEVNVDNLDSINKIVDFISQKSAK